MEASSHPNAAIMTPPSNLAVSIFDFIFSLKASRVEEPAATHSVGDITQMSRRFQPDRRLARKLSTAIHANSDCVIGTVCRMGRIFCSRRSAIQPSCGSWPITSMAGTNWLLAALAVLLNFSNSDNNSSTACVALS
jgi:hypothetical protein